MLRLLLVFLILRCAAAASEETESSGNSCGDEHSDDECDDGEVTSRRLPIDNAELDKSKGEIDETNADEKGTLIIIIAAVSVVALAIVAVIAIVFFRRYLQSQEQGVYSMPVDQVEKAAV